MSKINEFLNAVSQNSILYALELLKNPEIQSNINYVDELGSTALHLVCRYYQDFALVKSGRVESYELVHKIIKKGANVNTVDAEGKTPIMIALENKKYDIANILLLAGATINRDQMQSTETRYCAFYSSMYSSQDREELINSIIKQVGLDFFHQLCMDQMPPKL